MDKLHIVANLDGMLLNFGFGLFWIVLVLDLKV